MKIDVVETIWPSTCRAEAQAEGWDLGLTIDENKAVQSAYLHIFSYGPKFTGRNDAAAHVLRAAQSGSKLHIRALSACQVTRSGIGAKGKKA